ncbi:MAG: GNAT family N-acetyltransferase [Chloroflexota bacterium]|nr:GNAT family N-acetyltransferase [Chloroflexota bacterium]
MPSEPEVSLRSWTDDDLPLLRGLLADPGMMTYLGGPESEEKLLERHGRYLAIDGTGTGRVFVITVGPERTAAGWIGYWQTSWHDEPAWETGWSVLPEFQGRGLATRGAALALEAAAVEGRYRFVYAFPAVENGASNAVCARLGFEMLGSESLEYPPGTSMECAIWRLELPPEG